MVTSPEWSEASANCFACVRLAARELRDWLPESGARAVKIVKQGRLGNLVHGTARVQGGPFGTLLRRRAWKTECLRYSRKALVR
jgi:hypothetical protein